MEKRGIGHVEFILAFLIFVLIVLFTFYFFSPVKSTRLKESSLVYAYKEVLSESSTSLDSYSVKIVDTTSPVIAIQLEDLGSKNIAAEDYYGARLEISRLNSVAYVKPQGKNFVLIRASDGIDQASDFEDKPMVNTSKYQITLISTDSVISSKKMETLKSQYESNYTDFKKTIGIPTNVNFAFGMIYSASDKITALANAPQSQEVFSHSERLQSIKQDGKNLFGEFWVRVW